MDASRDSGLTTFAFPARAEAAAAARRALATVARLDPLRLAEAQLMVTELIANALQHAGLEDSSEIRMVVDCDAARVRVTISHQATGGFSVVTPGMGFTLVEGMSRRWDVTERDGLLEAWFEVRAAGTATALFDLSDDDVLAKAKEDPAFREEALRRFGDLATGLARRFRGKGVADADLEQVALFGLLSAITRYDVDKGHFKPFAIVTIQGELKRQLRDRAWSVRVPRALQELSLLVAGTAEALSQSLGRTVSAAEIAAELGLSEDEVIEGIAANSAYQWESIDSPNDTGGTMAELLHDEELAHQSDEWEVLAEGLRALTPRERELLYLRFYRDLTQTEIAESLGISQMQVSRLLTRTTERLRHLVG